MTKTTSSAKPLIPRLAHITFGKKVMHLNIARWVEAQMATWPNQPVLFVYSWEVGRGCVPAGGTHPFVASGWSNISCPSPTLPPIDDHTAWLTSGKFGTRQERGRNEDENKVRRELDTFSFFLFFYFFSIFNTTLSPHHWHAIESPVGDALAHKVGLACRTDRDRHSPIQNESKKTHLS